MKQVLFFLLAVSTAGLLTVGAGAIWLRQDRTGMLTTLCKAGLPNFSRPSVVDAEDLGCVILSPRHRVSGILHTGFETSVISSPDLRRTGDPGPHGHAWYTCNQATDCDGPMDRRLERQLAQRYPGLCSESIAQLTVEGWVTETPGGYGHLNAYPAEFYEDRVISVAPPPRAYLDQMRRDLVAAGLTECPAGEM